ncbi:MAG: hypothetical protein WBQ18_19520 [Solirubrobacteraceae bacterium]
MSRGPDVLLGRLPSDITAGDYWKVVDTDGMLVKWLVAVPMSYGFALANLVNHTVREHEDGTISVRPGDGSSNSILVTGHHGEQWHGYIERGEFTP